MFWTTGSKGSVPNEKFEWCSTDGGVKREGTAPSWAEATKEMNFINDSCLALNLKGSNIGISYGDCGGLHSVLCEVILMNSAK